MEEENDLYRYWRTDDCSLDVQRRPEGTTFRYRRENSERFADANDHFSR